ncbi:hypothetical protein GJ496_000018 [Pomphorhynchus laevis]|nr:hypothetical protein GJ496_000018 [Pomphorhynchus laevis]
MPSKPKCSRITYCSMQNTVLLLHNQRRLMSWINDSVKIGKPRSIDNNKFLIKFLPFLCLCVSFMYLLNHFIRLRADIKQKSKIKSSEPVVDEDILKQVKELYHHDYEMVSVPRR